MSRLLDLTDQQFGLWTVLSRAENSTTGQARWLCECSCGTVRVVLSHSLVHKKSLDCGCGRKATLTEQLTSHNMTQTLTYRRWCDMKTRVQRNPYYAQVSICARWSDFIIFLTDMGPCPETYSLERIDVYGDYTPSNCKWLPMREQPRNTRRSVKYTHLGVTRCIAEWCDVLQLNRNRIWGRIYRGWPIGQALELEPRTSL